MNTIGTDITASTGLSPVRPEPVDRNRPIGTDRFGSGAVSSPSPVDQTDQTYPPAVQFDRSTAQTLQELQSTDSTVRDNRSSAATPLVTVQGPDGASYAVAEKPAASPSPATSQQAGEGSAGGTGQGPSSNAAQAANVSQQSQSDQTLSPAVAATVAQPQISGQQYAQVNQAYLAAQDVNKPPTQAFSA